MSRITAAPYVAAIRELKDEWHQGKISLAQLRDGARGAWDAVAKAPSNVKAAVLRAIREEVGVMSTGSLYRSNSGSEESTPIANPGEFEDGKSLYQFQFGAYSWTKVYVWADSDESAFEIAVEWLDDHAPGHLVSLDENDLRRAAEDEGIEWQPHWPDYDDPEFQRVVAAAEADLTLIGHTTLKHGQYVASWEWTFHEVTDPTEYERVAAESAALQEE